VRVALIVAASVLTTAPALAQGTTPPADAIGVEADAGGCPTRAELVAALEARLPRATLDEDDSHEGARRLLVDRAGEDGAVRLRLLDAAGATALERRLEAGPGGPAPSRGGGRCAALAEAAAQVVARYLKELGYRAPASETAATPPAPAAQPPRVPIVVASPAPGPPAPADWLGLIGLTGGGRRGIGGGSAWSRSELLLGLEVRRRWLTVSVAGGITSRTDVAIPGSEPDTVLLLRSYPLRVAVGAALPGPLGGTLLPAVGANLDWLSFKGQGVVLDDPGSGTRFDPALEAGAGWGRRFGHLMLVVRLAAGWSLQPRDFDAHRADPIFRTPAGYLRAAIETAFVLGR
jgi:hypothetical protein